MQAMMAAWGDQLRDTYGKEMPEDYLTFDCETTGVDALADVPLEIGHCVVRGCQVVNRGSFVLNWAKLWEGDRRRRFWGDVAEICDVMRGNGHNWRLDKAFIRQHGHHPRKVMQFYRKLCQANREANAFFVGHNAWRFDVFLLERMWEELGLNDFQFGPMEVLDTGGMEKAPQVDRPPYPGETMEEYFVTVAGIAAKGVRWSMDHCIQKYGFEKKYGIDPNKAHQAEQDAYCCHLLFEEHRPNGHDVFCS